MTTPSRPRAHQILTVLVALVASPIAACGAAGDDEERADVIASTTSTASLPGVGGARRVRREWKWSLASAEDEFLVDAGAEEPAGSVDQGTVSPPDPTPAPATPMPYRGVNLAGAEFGSAIPGSFGVDYTFATASEVDYFVSKGMNTFRVGFKWERLQRSAYGAFDAAYLGRLDAIVSHATSKKAHVILNPHNFARYYGSTVGSSAVPKGVFADLWRRLAAKYASNPLVMFNLVNEPHTMPTEQWVSAANAAIAAIRGVGATNKIIVPGNAWTGAHSWTSSWYGTSNAVAMLAIDDPADNILFEVHQYLDAEASGGSDQCVGTKAGRERLAPFVKWLRDTGRRGFVGELAGGDNPTCRAAVSDMLAFMMESADVLDGWLWWAAGPWWGGYAFALDPIGGKDRPQMALLEPFLSW